MGRAPAPNSAAMSQKLAEKRDQDARAREEHKASLSVKKAAQLLKTALNQKTEPANFTDLVHSLESVLQEKMDDMGSLADKVFDEVQKLLLIAYEKEWVN